MSTSTTFPRVSTTAKSFTHAPRSTTVLTSRSRRFSDVAKRYIVPCSIVALILAIAVIAAMNRSTQTNLHLLQPLPSDQTARSVTEAAAVPVSDWMSNVLHIVVTTSKQHDSELTASQLKLQLQEQWRKSNLHVDRRVSVAVPLAPQAWRRRLGAPEAAEIPVLVLWQSGNPGAAVVLWGSGELQTFDLPASASGKDLPCFSEMSRYGWFDSESLQANNR